MLVGYVLIYVSMFFYNYKVSTFDISRLAIIGDYKFFKLQDNHAIMTKNTTNRV